ncbi:MAG TPA: plastocyanin/azurin family copper-binding protein [Chthonomonadaceae bacterium]|nr:plastocyanin/azurin family copper-binding protein [Chthonomonadaceae bacterium]
MRSIRGVLLAVCLMAALIRPAAASTVTVHIFNFSFSNNVQGQPVVSTTNVNVGDTVHWVWDQGMHSTTSDSTSQEVWDSTVLTQGSTFDHTFNTAGTFTYHCSLHATIGMTGTIIVGNTSTPAISSLSPSSGTTGSGAFTLTVNGSNFVSGAVVDWTENGTLTPLTTTFVSASQVTASVPASLVASAGSASITVSQGGLTSNAVTFDINNPAPVLSSIKPTSINAAGSGFTLAVNGSAFINGSVVHWKAGTTDTPLTTTFVSASKLTASVPSSLIASPGMASVFVVTASPGGGTSVSKTFKILVTTLTLSVDSLTKDSSGNYVAAIELHNIGNLSANNTTIKKATMGAAATSTTLPVSVGSIAAGTSGSTTLTFPGSAGASGTTVALKVSGTFTGGTFMTSLKVKLP